MVLGGIHPSMMPEEASQHSNAVVIGEAEEIWPELIADFRSGNMKKVYRCDTPPNLSGLPLPRRDLLKKSAYSTINVIQTTRGCPYNCNFCTVTRFFGSKYRSRPIDEVIKEVESLQGKFIYFAEADLVGNPSYAKKLFERLIPYKKKWISDVGIRVARDKELLRLAAKSGCKIVYIGFESLSPESLQEAGKSQNIVEDYKECIDRIHQFGIAVGGSFMFGFDTDNKSVFERTAEFAIESKLDFADFNNLCPYPGTRLYYKLQKEGRILVNDWSNYFAMSNVVFQPKQMSVEDLEDGSIWAWNQFYSNKSIFKRFFLQHNFTSWFHPAAYLLVNIENKRSLSKLNKKGHNPT